MSSGGGGDGGTRCFLPNLVKATVFKLAFPHNARLSTDQADIDNKGHADTLAVMASDNMFTEGRRALEERVFSVENDREAAEENAAMMVAMCTTLGMSTDNAASVPEILEVVNRAWAVARNAPFGNCIHNVSKCEADDLKCLVEATVKDEEGEEMEGYPASCKLNGTQRKRIYDAFNQQEHVDEVVIHRLFDELVEATGLSTLPNESVEMLWNWNRSIQNFSRADVEAWKNATLDEAAGSM